MSPHAKPFTSNLLISTLGDDDLELIQPHLAREKLERGKFLFAANEPIEHVWFPEGGVASLTTSGKDGHEPTEVGIFGFEGFTGAPLLLGADRSPYDAFIQINGSTGLRIEAAKFTKLLDRSATLRTVLSRYVHVFTVQAAQTASSNAHQWIEARLARWLLMSHDRVDGDEIELTHQFMAMMIAADRSSVTVSLHILEGGGMIKSTRGRVMILDRDKLEELAGDGYGVPEAEYRRLIAPFGKSNLDEAGVTSIIAALPS